MSVPYVGPRSLRLKHLITTLAMCATFQRLVGADTVEEAAARIAIDVDLDTGPENLPRAVIRHQGPAVSIRQGSTTFLASGEMGIFVQYLQFTDDQLAEWYEIAGPFTDADRRMHMNNVVGQITDEMSANATEAGCLEIQKLEEFSCGDDDPVEENGLQIVELVWVIGREGLP